MAKIQRLNRFPLTGKENEMDHGHRRIIIPFIRRKGHFSGGRGWKNLCLVVAWPPFFEWIFGGIFEPQPTEGKG